MVSMEQAVALVATGVAQAGDANAAILRISQASQHAVSMVEEITAAIREQSQAVSNEIAGNVENIALMAKEAARRRRTVLIRRPTSITSPRSFRPS